MLLTKNDTKSRRTGSWTARISFRPSLDTQRLSLCEGSTIPVGERSVSQGRRGHFIPPDTFKIGLAPFLSNMRDIDCTSIKGSNEYTVVGITTVYNNYISYIIYPYEANRRHYLHAGKRRTYTQMVGTNEGAKHFVRWMMYSGRLKQFALAKRLLFDSE